MILTVTLNAAIDRTVAVPSFRQGHRHRAVEASTVAGGKGVNVARALKLLDRPVIATGLAGGPTGARLMERLAEESILTDFTWIAGESRTNLAVVDPTSGEQTEINERGPAVSGKEIELFRDKLLYLSRGADVVVFAGSLPRGVEESLPDEQRRKKDKTYVIEVDRNEPVKVDGLSGDKTVMFKNSVSNLIAQFKAGFGGRQVDYVGARDLRLRPAQDVALRVLLPAYGIAQRARLVALAVALLARSEPLGVLPAALLFGVEARFLPGLIFLPSLGIAAVLFGVLASSMSISEEIEGRTAITLMSKPVSRRQSSGGRQSVAARVAWAGPCLASCCRGSPITTI